VIVVAVCAIADCVKLSIVIMGYIASVDNWFGAMSSMACDGFPSLSYRTTSVMIIRMV